MSSTPCPTTPTSSKRVLEPIERISEVLFGLIMVLTFTGSLSVAEAGRDDVRTMLIGALGCNLAWGIIDGVLYLMGCLAEKGRDLADAAGGAQGHRSAAGPAPHRGRVAAGGRVRPATGGTRSDAPAAEATARAARARASGQGRLARRARRVPAGVPVHVPGGDSVHLHAQRRRRPCASPTPSPS